MSRLPAKRAIAEIRFSKRHRRDLGDLDGLAANIRALGLLQPIAIERDGALVAGERRLKACAALGWREIPVHVVDIDAIERGELAENVYRKDFTPSEMVAICATVERRERERAKARQREAGRAKASGNFPEAGQVRDRIAAPLGVSGRTLEKARAVVQAAKAEPGKYRHLVEDMDRTGRVNGVFRRLKVAKQAEGILAEPPPLPNQGPYRVIVVDPPWPYEVRDDDPSHRGVRPYPSLSIDQICAMPVGALAHDDCLLWLWTTNHHMREAYKVLDAWGFEDKTILTWVKDRMGNGDWLRNQTEHALLATRGRPVVTLTNETTFLRGAVRGHSQKPLEFYDFIEKLCPAPRYAYLFSRYRHSDRWDCHGDQAPPAMEAAE